MRERLNAAPWCVLALTLTALAVGGCSATTRPRVPECKGPVTPINVPATAAAKAEQHGH